MHFRIEFVCEDRSFRYNISIKGIDTLGSIRPSLISALIVQTTPRSLHIENEWLPATLTLSPPAVWTHGNTPESYSLKTQK